jgi:hypothetical protein
MAQMILTAQFTPSNYLILYMATDIVSMNVLIEGWKWNAFEINNTDYKTDVCNVVFLAYFPYFEK